MVAMQTTVRNFLVRVEDYSGLKVPGTFGEVPQITSGHVLPTHSQLVSHSANLQVF